MCYSAQIWADYRKYERFGGELSVAGFTKLFWERKKAGDWIRKVPKGVRDALAGPRDGAGFELPKLIAEASREAADDASTERASQSERLAKAEVFLAGPRPTKKAANDQRIAKDKIARAERDLEDLARKDPLPRDSRMFPGQFVPVLIELDGKRQIIPMRYQCRLPGWTEIVERRYPGTYNARRDNLGKAWKDLFGHKHGLIGVERFYENVERAGKNAVIEFVPSDHKPMIVACLWNLSRNKDGSDLWSFAAITDEPPPEVAEAGHDRCIIQIRPANVDAWLNPGLANLAAMQAILDDRPRPYYEHRLAA